MDSRDQIKKRLPGRRAAGLMLAALAICILTFASFVFGDGDDAGVVPAPQRLASGSENVERRE